MYIDTDTDVMKDKNEEPAKLDLQEYVKSICEEADRRSAERTAMFEKAMGINGTQQLTPTPNDEGIKDTMSYLNGLQSEKEAALRENAAMLNEAMQDSKTDTQFNMKDEMQRAAQEAAEAVKQDYIKRGLYKEEGKVNYQATIQEMYGKKEAESEARRKDAMKNLLKDIDSKRS